MSPCLINFAFFLHRITYCPRKVGVYIIRVLDQENCTAGDPINVDVFDPGMIKVSKLGDITLGESSFLFYFLIVMTQNDL